MNVQVRTCDGLLAPYRRGNVFRALRTVDDLTADLETLHPEKEPTKLGKAVREFDSYLRANAQRRRAGEAISTAFVEPPSTR